MEVRMQPRSEGPQRCLSFQVIGHPARRACSTYRDYLGNIVHHFDVPGAHRQLTIVAEALVDVRPRPDLPCASGADAWRQLDAQLASGDYWEMLMPSHFAQSTESHRTVSPPSSGLLDVRQRGGAIRWSLSSESELRDLRRDRVRAEEHARGFAHRRRARSRQGVCQDFAHIMIALVRRIGIPCRYVSGYLFHRAGEQVTVHRRRHARLGGGATCPAWAGWASTRPTTSWPARRHVRTAVGRDYADVPPTRGVFKGDAASELTVAVRVAPSDKPPPPEAEIESEDWSEVLHESHAESDREAAEQQQQQKQ